ncbi:polysaccharide deacetylase family protein [Acuticoccus mangrovi]|uniref:Polysaccharide deacetylase n=1 Tax=Acuticoccus mangrovi TaxID=2796142 RepID=A0A934MIG1_9HYPH|nr:hypothetical protein [Acuticoccus mangrovi]MBJ3777161.1 hypothetical protein [Acuticoccus mangrovi]
MEDGGLMEGLAPLVAALDAAAAAGRPRAFWWRDDDAVRVGPRLCALREVAARHGAPLSLAVIPAGVEAGLLDWCGEEGVDVLQHGVAHANHERHGKSAELGAARPVATIVAECVAARERLARSAAFLPVMVPPWNRMREDLAPALAEAGYRGLSRFGGPPVAGVLLRVDTHVDPIAWRTTRDLHAPEIRAAILAEAMAGEGPVGLLTHHAVHTAAVDAFVAAFVRLVSAHEGAVWRSARDLFGAS